MDSETRKNFKVFLQIVLLVVQAVGVGLLIPYVVSTKKIALGTVDMASKTADMASKTKDMATTSAEANKLSNKILEEMRKAREQELAPLLRIIPGVDSSQEDAVLYLTVDNVGKFPADNLRLKFMPPLQSASANSIQHQLLNKEGIASLPPNMSLIIKMGSFREYFKRNYFAKVYNVSVSYSTRSRSEEITEDLIVDMNIAKYRFKQD